MLIRCEPVIPSSEITDHRLYLRRREFLKAAGLAAIALGSANPALAAFELAPAEHTQVGRPPRLDGIRKGPFGTTEAQTPYDAVTTYNNFYEFGTDKSSPAKYAGSLRTRPWTVKVDGECGRPAEYQLEDFLKPGALEERVYRMRCVEGWSMVIPWVGFPLADLLKRVEPNTRAKFVEFTTLRDPKQMPGQQSDVLEWPYVEGLRIDEAMHPLAIFATGLYGQELPPQDGAPVKLVVPWKYGFKGIKSIVKITLTDRQPPTSWNRHAPGEYGFFANVNPHHDHPR
jgi:sulfoxide reductase catalytic subunit YedY